MWEEEEVLEVDGNDSGATVWGYLTCLSCILKDS